MGEYLPDINDIGDNSENNRENIDNKKKKFDFKKITTIEINENNNIKEANSEEKDLVNELSENGDIEDKVGSEEHINMSDESSGIGNSDLRNDEKSETVKFSHISPSSIRIFKVFDEEEMYKMIFKLEKNTEKVIIAVSIAGEQASIPVVIKKAKDNNGKILESKFNKITVKNLIENKKYSILFSLNDNENYPVEVKMYGDKI